MHDAVRRHPLPCVRGVAVSSDDALIRTSCEGHCAGRRRCLGADKVTAGRDADPCAGQGAPVEADAGGGEVPLDCRNCRRRKDRPQLCQRTAAIDAAGAGYSGGDRGRAAGKGDAAGGVDKGDAGGVGGAAARPRLERAYSVLERVRLVATRCKCLAASAMLFGMMTVTIKTTIKSQPSAFLFAIARS